MQKEDIPSFRQSIKNGWKAIFLPITVFLPFLLTSKFETFFVGRLGEAGAKSFDNSLLLFIPALIVVVAIALSDKKTKKEMSLTNMTKFVTAAHRTVLCVM